MSTLTKLNEYAKDCYILSSCDIHRAYDSFRQLAVFTRPSDAVVFIKLHRDELEIEDSEEDGIKPIDEMDFEDIYKFQLIDYIHLERVDLVQYISDEERKFSHEY